MSEQTTIVPREKYEYAVLLLSDGKTEGEVRAILVEKGMDEATAYAVIAKAKNVDYAVAGRNPAR